MEQLEKHPLIDLDHIVKSRSGKKAKYIPKFIVNLLKRIIHQDELNAITQNNEGKFGIDFADGALNDLNVKAKLKFINQESLNKNGRYIFVSNHPLGGLDGLILMSTLGEIMGDIKFVVNDLLMNIKPLEPIFVPINKHGRMSKNYSIVINEAYSSNSQILYFPAGLCSRLIKGEIKDLEWQKNFLRQALKYDRDIVPMYFGGTNSKFFYRLAKFRKFLGIKFNFEMIFLPDEMIRKKNSIFDVVIGEPISIEQIRHQQAEGKKLDEICNSIRTTCYNLKKCLHND